MISLDKLKQDPNLYKQAAINKNRKVDIDRIIELDNVVSALSKESQDLRTKRNKLAELGKTDPEAARQEGQKIKEQLKVLEEKLQSTQSELKQELERVPNAPLPEVPIGKDESSNVEIKRVGTPNSFTFTPKDHIELGQELDIIDLKRGSKVSGFRGYFLKNEGALLQMAVLTHVFQKLAKKGYTAVSAPSIVKGFSLFGTAQFPWGKDEVYELNDSDSYLSGTAEVPVTSYFADETLEQEMLPYRFAAISPCFRKEAGSYGKDTKGLYRVHEFFKVEQVVLCENDIEKAKEIHEELQKNCEEILKDLELPYRVLLMCTGDMGEPQLKKYDTETWMPGRQNYGETMSNSIMGDFQTRRLNIRYKDKNGKTEYCYSLNNTALATPRILIALLENHQREDGSIHIPEKLQALCGFTEIKKK